MKTFLAEEGCALALWESLYAALEGSVGTAQYRTLYRRMPDGTLDDVIDNGDLGCAYFVSSMLSAFGLISHGVHTTVRMTLSDMQESGWIEVGDPEPGSVVLWGEKHGDDGRPHFHMGICVDPTHAIEHSAITKSPRKIGITELKMPDGSPRPPIAYFVHPKLRL